VISATIRVNVFDEHQDPVEISCTPEFLRWLIDLILNGVGALFVFGCYGANLAPIHFVHARSMNGW
jgi:hypothetical protein